MLSTGQQTILIKSDPPGATVYENGAALGNAPYTYTYDKKDGGAASLELRMDGRQNKAFALMPKTQNAILFADAMLLNIPYYLGDNKSKKLRCFQRKEFTLNLYRDVPEKAERKELLVVTLESKLGSDAKVGKFGAHPLYTDSRELNALDYADDLGSEITGGLREGIFDAKNVRIGNQKGDETVRRAKVYLKPVLMSLAMDLDDVDGKAYGEVAMEMDWKFFSGVQKDSLLFNIDKHTTYPVFGQSPREVLSLAMHDAARQLADEPGIAEKMGKAFDAGLVSSKGSSITLDTPTPIAFTGRKDMLSALVKGVVTIETSNGHGSGFLITNDGYLITNAHVVEDEHTVKVRFQQGFTLDGEVVKVNKDFDVALVKTPGNDLPALSIGDDTALQLGEELFAIGTPLDESLGQTVTRGIMSGKREFEGRSFIQTDVSINPGNSGGPLIDENGKVVGVATMKIRETGVQGIGFGVPLSKAIEMLNINFVK